MPQRRFLIASALARLIRTEQGVAGRVVEGYFPPRPDREHFVSIEPGHSFLVLASRQGGPEADERTEVPRSQAEALMAVCAGRVGFECSLVPLRGGQDILLQRFIAPGPLDLLTVEFASTEDARAFVQPAWFGPEVSQNPAYDRGALARVGVPSSEEILLSNAMLDELLDTLERKPGGSLHELRPSTQQASRPEGQRLPEALDIGQVTAGLAQALESFSTREPTPEADETEADLVPERRVAQH